jgi:chemotaxis protein histidine kinase CheA
MVKRTRKPPIKPELRRDWLRRNEENGESPPQIAANDKYDIRTVRKQIELAKQEREAREARSLVLRNALEQHYDDLRKFAEKLNSQISGLDNIPQSQDDDLIEAALRQHLPRSPIWSYMSKWQSLCQKSNEQMQNIESLIEQAAKEHPKLTPLVDTGLNGIIPGIVVALTFQAKQWSHGNGGLNPKDNLLTEPVGEGFVSLRYGFSQMGKIDAEHADRYTEMVREVLVDLESSLRDSETYHDLEKTVAEIGRLGRKLREELAVIRLRRIVPGRCKYCPL